MVKKTAAVPTAKKKVSALSAIKKKFADGVKIGAFMNTGPIDVLSTGSLSTDIATGIGGVPRGAIVEISGEEGSAKTTTCLKIAADGQRRGYKIAYIDTEYILDPSWVAKMGVKLSEDDPNEGMIIINADSLEKAGEVAVLLAESGEFDIIFFDSIAGAPIEAQLEGELGDANMGKRAKILSTFLPKLNGPVRKNNVWFIFTNQVRFSMEAYGDKFVTPGGKAVPFHCAIRIRLSARKEKVAQGQVPSYTTITSKLVKNKLSPPFRQGEYDLTFEDAAFDTTKEVSQILTDGKNLDLLGITRAAAFYTLPWEMIPKKDNGEYAYEQKFQGAPKVLEMLFSDIDHLNNKVIPYIRSKLIAHEDLGFREHQGAAADVEFDDDDEEE